MNTIAAVSIAVFVLGVSLLVFLRANNARFKVKPSDVVVALIPVITLLLATGKLHTFQIGEGGVKVETTFAVASRMETISQLSSFRRSPGRGMPPTPMPYPVRSSFSRPFNQQTEGLLVNLNEKSYWESEVEEYLIRFLEQPFADYLIIQHQSGAFFAMASTRELTSLFQAKYPPYTPHDLARWLSVSNAKVLSTLPGFIDSRYAVTNDENGNIPDEIEFTDVPILPVIDQTGQFIGIVESATAGETSTTSMTEKGNE